MDGRRSSQEGWMNFKERWRKEKSRINVTAEVELVEKGMNGAAEGEVKEEKSVTLKPKMALRRRRMKSGGLEAEAPPGS